MAENSSRSTRTANPQAPHRPLEQLLDLLACPACLGPLRIAPAQVVCSACGRIYPLLDGIPVLLVDRAALPT